MRGATGGVAARTTCGRERELLGSALVGFESAIAAFGAVIGSLGAECDRSGAALANLGAGLLAFGWGTLASGATGLSASNRDGPSPRVGSRRFTKPRPRGQARRLAAIDSRGRFGQPGNEQPLLVTSASRGAP